MRVGVIQIVRQKLAEAKTPAFRLDVEVCWVHMIGYNVAMPDLTFIKSQEFTLEGVAYSVSVYQASDGYVAFCDCHRCDGHNMRSQPRPTPEEAAAECEDLITNHHGQCHGPDCAVE